MTKNNEQSARMWCVACHLASLVCFPLFFLGVGLLNRSVYIPFLNILFPLIIWKSKKAQHPLIDLHGKTCLNFQISMTIYFIIWLIMVLFMATDCGRAMGDIIANTSLFNRRFIQILSVFSLPAVLIVMSQVVCSISAAIMASLGKLYRYPSSIQFLK